MNATPARKKSTPPKRLALLVATRKGAWIFHGDAKRKSWTADGLHFLGHTVSHLRLDPRDGRTLLAAARTGHLGPTIFRSTNLGRTWKKPPSRRPSPTWRAARRRARSTTASGSLRATPASAAAGTPALRRRACSAPKTAA